MVIFNVAYYHYNFRASLQTSRPIFCVGVSPPLTPINRADVLRDGQLRSKKGTLMKKQTCPYELATAEDGTRRLMTVGEVYEGNSLLPNALQNAVLEAVQAVGDLALTLKLDLPETSGRIEMLVQHWPVLRAGCASGLLNADVLTMLVELHSVRLALLQDTAGVASSAGNDIAA